MSGFFKRYLWLVGGLLLTSCFSSPEVPGSSLMVAAGDSFSAGGVLSSSSSCGRADESWVQVLALEYGYEFNNQACSGARIADVYAQMLLVPDADVVALTVGGNDFGFLELATACVIGDCTVASDDAAANFRGLYPQITDMLRHVARQRHIKGVGGRMVILSGYPDVIGSGSAPWCHVFSLSDRLQVVSAVQVLNDTLSAAVDEVSDEGFAVFFVSQRRFVDHGACDRDPWVHTAFESMPFHPTAEGYRQMAAAVNVSQL